MTAARVGIVVLNWNGLDDTRACLRSVRSDGADAHPTYVVDNGSAGGQAATIAAEFPWATVLPQPSNLGFTGGCNVGIARALADGCTHVLLLNNDAVVEEGFLARLLEAHAAEAAPGAVGSLLLHDDDRVWAAGGRVSVATGFTVLGGKGRRAGSYDGEPPFETEVVPGTSLLVGADLLREAGPLDDAYFAYYEDGEWSARFRRLGRRNLVVPASRVHHRTSSSTGQPGTVRMGRVKAYFMARNAFLFARQTMTAPRRAVFLVAQVAVRAPYNLALRCQPGGRAGYVRGLADGLTGRFGPPRLRP